MDHTAMAVELALKSWQIQIRNTNKLLNELSDEALLYEVSPGRNRVIYILGHLIAVHDNMIPLLGLGERLFPQLDEIFLKSPDKSAHVLPSVTELREDWTKVNQVLAEKFAMVQNDEWFARHTAVSEADFAKEPTRNRLNVLISRTAHLAYHLGQLVLVKGTVRD